MADVRISDLPSTDLVGRQDIVPIVQVGSTKRVTVSGFLIQSENDLRAYADQAEIDAIATASGYTDGKFNEAVTTVSGYTDSKFNEAVATASGYAIDSLNTAVATASGYAIDSLTAANAYTNAQIDPLNDFRIWDATRVYDTNDPTFREGVPYRSLITSNSGFDPLTNPDKWEIVGGGGSGGIENFLKNDLTKNSILYITASGQTSLEWDITASGVLTAGAVKAVYPVSGTGRYLDIELDDVNPNDVGQPWYVKFSYILGTNADDLVSVVLFDGTNEIPTAIGLLPYAGGTLQVTGGAVLPNNVLTGQKLRFKFKDNTAITFYLADVSVGPQNMLAGAAVGATQVYIPVIAATTTNPTKGTVVEDIGTWARHGDQMIWSYRYRQSSSGSAGNGTYLIGLPPGISIDLTKHPVNSLVGGAFITNVADENSVVSTEGMAYVYSATELYIKYNAGNNATATVTVWTHVATANLAATNLRFTMNAVFAVAGWTSNVNLASDFQEFAFNTQAAINTNDTTSFGYGSGGTPILANTAATYYDVQFLRPIQPTDKIELEVRSKVDGEWYCVSTLAVPSLWIPQLTQTFRDTSNNQYTSGMRYAKISNRLLRIIQSSTCYGGASSWDGSLGTSRSWAQVIAAADGYDRWRVRKISNGNMAEVPPLVYAEYAGINVAVSSGVPLNIDVRVEDTHNAVTTGVGVWKFTAPFDGLYRITTYFNDGDTFDTGPAELFKNGVRYTPGGISWIRLFSRVAGQSSGGAAATVRCRRGDYLDFRPAGADATASDVLVQFERIGS